MERHLLALVAVVKDEAHAIARTVESVRGIVDKYTILDSGSTDGTIAILEEALKDEANVDIHEESFVDYATTRNRALELEETSTRCGCDADHEQESDAAIYALSLSADETLHGGEALRAFLASYDGPDDAFLIEVRTPTGSFLYPRVLRTGSPWRYEGAIHEEPKHRDDPDRVPTITIPGCWIEYKPSDPARFARRLRDRDLPLLSKQLAEAKDPVSKARAVMLLAQTREQLSAACEGDLAGASQEMVSALGWHLLLLMDAEAPEDARRHAAWKYLCAAEQLGIYMPHEMVPRLARALQADPTNPNVAYMLARHTADIGPDGKVHGDPRAGMQAAQRAAKIARDAVADPRAPHDPHGLLWRSHFIAACCARALGHGPAAKRSAEAGIAGGGPAEAFEPFLR